jgi:hypothetical protein
MLKTPNEIPCFNVCTNNIESNYISMSFEGDITCWFFISEVCDNSSLNGSFYISMLIQIILHRKPLSRPLVRPLASICKSRKLCTPLINEVVITKVVVKASSCHHLKVYSWIWLKASQKASASSSTPWLHTTQIKMPKRTMACKLVKVYVKPF